MVLERTYEHLSVVDADAVRVLDEVKIGGLAECQERKASGTYTGTHYVVEMKSTSMDC